MCYRMYIHQFWLNLMSLFFHQIEYSLAENKGYLSNLPMNTPDAHLFRQIPSELQEANPNLILKSTFIVQQIEVAMALTPTHLLIFDQHSQSTPTHHASLAFDLKFQVIYQPLPPTVSPQTPYQGLGTPIAIKFERQNCPQQLTFSSHSSALIQAWAFELEKRVNQRNFHKLFKAKRKIGKGAFATVYLAERLRDQKMVAVKAFSKEKQYASEKGRDSLQNEIKLMRKLNHPNVMHLEGVYQTDNSIYVILEYLQGQQLNELIRSGRKLDSHEIKAVLQSILRGVSHLSANRIIHRDLKPENIMFRQEGSNEVALCDLGLATLADEEKYLFVRCGTPGFVAPEIINIKDMSTKSQPISDVFSVGVIMHYLLLGYSVFEGKKYNEILSQNRVCDFNFGKEIYGTLPPNTFDLLTRMLEKDPARRISADSALNHAYFNSSMEAERSVFTNSVSNKGLLQPKKEEMECFTPSTVPYKKENSLNRGGLFEVRRGVR